MATGVKELKLWQESVALAGDVIRTMRHNNRREIKGFTDRVMAVGADVAAHVAHGYSRAEMVEQRPHFFEARRSLFELEAYLGIARHAGLIPATTLTQLGTRCTNVSRLVSAYLAYLDRQLESERSRPARS